MFRLNWVCFDCRKVRRHAGTRMIAWSMSHELPHCPQCGLPMTCIGLTPVPPAGKLKCWQQLMRSYLAPKMSRGVDVLKENQMHNFMSLIEYRSGTSKAARRKYRRAEKLRQDLASRA